MTKPNPFLPFLYGLSQTGLAQSVLKWGHALAYSGWRMFNPRASHGDFYAARIAGTLALGLPHPTLGRRSVRSKAQSRVAVWTPSNHADRARGWLPRLQAFGLSAEMRCVDYGCGSLRIGQHIIGFLAPGRYLGLDVTDRFFEEGLLLLDPSVRAEKRPACRLIDEAVLDELRRSPPDFVFCNAVLQHVPPDELSDFLRRIGMMIGDETRACVTFIASARPRHFGVMNWSYPADQLIAALAAVDSGLEVEVSVLNSAAEDRRGRARSALLIRRRRADLG